MKSKTFGELSVGRTDTATQSITEITLASNGAHKNADPEDYFSAFQLRTAPGAAGLSGLEWRRLVKDDFNQPGDSSRGNVIAYKTPAIAGFTLMTAYGEDDSWDVALRYAGEFGDIKVKAGIGYGENHESNGGSPPCIVNDTGTTDADCEQIGGVCQHHARTDRTLCNCWRGSIY